MKSDFCVAVHALVYLNHKSKVLSSEELAENICTNPARVRKVMACLRKAGLVDTREGNEGGYHFLKDPGKVTLAMVADALDIRFVATGWYSGDMNKPCVVSSGMAGIMEEILDGLDQTCRQELSRKTIAHIDSQIFGSGGQGEEKEVKGDMAETQ